MTAHPLTLEQTLTIAILCIVILTGYITIVYYDRRSRRRTHRSVHMQIEIMLLQYNSLPYKIIVPMPIYNQFCSERGHPTDDGTGDAGEWSPDMEVYGVPVVCGEVREITFRWKTDKTHV